MALDWVRLSEYCRKSGETPDAVDKRIRSGYWLKGVHVNLPQGSRELWVYEPAVNDWAAGKTPPDRHGRGAK